MTTYLGSRVLDLAASLFALMGCSRAPTRQDVCVYSSATERNRPSLDTHHLRTSPAKGLIIGALWQTDRRPGQDRPEHHPRRRGRLGYIRR